MARPMTMAEKILADHAGLEEVVPGQLVECDLDLVLANDITAPIAIKTVREIGAGVFDRDRICLVPDHYSPNKDIKSAEQTKVTRDFAHEHQITNYFEQGCMGIEHALLPEQGIVVPGDLMIGADSHTCTYGGIGAFSTGVGSTDAGVGMATGRAWFKVPETIRFEIDGELPEGASAKDIILHIIGKIGVDGALYCAMEFGGSAIEALSVEGRLTIANMAIEAGGKAGLFEVDDKCREYVERRAKRPIREYHPDADATYKQLIKTDASEIVPCVSWPHLPSNTHPATSPSTRPSLAPAPTGASRTCVPRRRSCAVAWWPTRCAASSSRPPRASGSSASTRALWTSSSTPTAWSPRPPAALAWAATWASSPRARGA